MKNETNEKITLPLLVAKNFVLFPYRKEEVVDAGREISIKAITASRAMCDSLMLMVCQKSAQTESPKVEDLYSVGTLCRIVSYAEMKGFIRIRVSGSHRVSLKNVTMNSEGYYEAEYNVLNDIQGDAKQELILTKKILKSIDENPKVWQYLPSNVVSTMNTKGVTASELADISANSLTMTTPERQDILETLNINDRLERILKIVEAAKLSEDIEKDLQKDVGKLNEKAQKEYLLREKMKAIRQELGEDVDSKTDEEAIKKLLDENPYPQYVKDKVKSELKRYQMMPPGSLESSLIKSYIDILMDVPWFEKTDDNTDLKTAAKILDEDHFGLEEPKKRILEYLAVKQMTGNLKAPIMCLYGPPGVGKTSLGRSVARALGRKFFKASLGGISDEAEIRGHRRTYVGSMPGRIISGMRKAGVVNPVFLLDEVDKLASSYKGDPASALLEVLDPEQNIIFNDNYLEEPYDLSNVLFICTANDIANIPGPLRDRLEMIEVNSYTELEKVQIAKKWLLKKQLELNGLKLSDVTFNDEAIHSIINNYTMEAGVRNLERAIASIIRKIIVELLTKKVEKPFVVDEKAVKKYLGVPKFTSSKAEKKPQVGLVTGLAYTQYGGDLTPIEVNKYPGKGGLVLTGKLGDVMKESANIALSYVRANHEKYNIDSDIFEKNIIHIHFPEGAVPKDGPSAGVAITLAIISCLTEKPVNNLVALTGEVSLRGNALPIGGLREKSLAAYRSGIKTIIIPDENRRDVPQLPKEVKNNLNIVYMKTVDDAYKVAFSLE